MADTILVLGATGTIGGRVVKLLTGERGRGARIVAGVRNLDKAKPLETMGARLAEVDFDRPGTVENAIGNVDKLFFLTPPDMTMLSQAAAVLSAAEASGVKYIVRLSALGAEAEPGIALTRMHRSVEKGLSGSGIPYTFLRPNGFMQNFEQFADSIKREGKLALPLEDARVSYIDADDIAAVAVALLTDPTNQHMGKMYDLTGPDAISGADVAATFTRVLGKPVEYISAPDRAARESMVGAGVPPPLVEGLIELYDAYKNGFGEVVTTSVASVLERAPKTFQQYVADNRAKYAD